jgi:hypothetical protein
VWGDGHHTIKKERSLSNGERSFDRLGKRSDSFSADAVHPLTVVRLHVTGESVTQWHRSVPRPLYRCVLLPKAIERGRKDVRTLGREVCAKRISDRVTPVGSSLANGEPRSKGRVVFFILLSSTDTLLYRCVRSVQVEGYVALSKSSSIALKEKQQRERLKRLNTISRSEDNEIEKPENVSLREGRDSRWSGTHRTHR